MREIRLSGSEGGAKLSFVPTPIIKGHATSVHGEYDFLYLVPQVSEDNENKILVLIRITG